MSNGKSGIRDLLAASDAGQRQARETIEALQKKLANCAKTIGGVECSFLTDGSNIDVRVRKGESLFTTDAENFWLMCGWFTKHYNGAGDPAGEEQSGK